MVKIYTKKGDKGQTSTIGCRMSKGDKTADVLGSIDEINSWIGVCRTKYRNLDRELKRIQNNLMIMTSGLAGSKLKIINEEVKHLEELIDKYTGEMPELHNFIYPAGYLHVARSMARRAEREIVKAGVKEATILKYANRLSDALFVMARWVSYQSGSKEEIWGK